MQSFRLFCNMLLLSRGLFAFNNKWTRYSLDAVRRSMSSSPDDNELMRKINAQAADNKHQPWSIADDQYLYDHRESPIEELVEILKRGKNGVIARIKHLSDPNHNAHRRLFNIETVIVPTLRPVVDVINRILYDPSLDPADFSFRFLDRFNGTQTRPATATNDDVKGPARKLIKAIPEHRISQILYKERVVWCKEERMDLVFGSTPRPLPIEVNTDETITVMSDNNDVSDETDETEENIVEDTFLDEDDNEWDDHGVSSTAPIGMTIYEAMATYDDWYIATQRIKSQQATLSATVPIFCDLDGVLVDFDAGVQKLFKNKKAAEISLKILWPKLATTPGFYENLPWMNDGRRLWQVLQGLHSQSKNTVTILTGVPRGTWAETQKRKWAARELGENIPVITCMSKDKHLHCPAPTLSEPASLDTTTTQQSEKPGTAEPLGITPKLDEKESLKDGVNSNGMGASKGAILIDDRESARDAWVAAGGQFIWHRDTTTTLQALETTLGISLDLKNNWDDYEYVGDGNSREGDASGGGGGNNRGGDMSTAKGSTKKNLVKKKVPETSPMTMVEGGDDDMTDMSWYDDLSSSSPSK